MSSNSLQFVGERPFEEGSQARLLGGAIQDIGTLGLSFASGYGAIATFRLIRMEYYHGSNGAFLFRFRRRIPRLLSKCEIRANNEFIRRRGKEPIGRYAARDRFLFRTTKWFSNAPIFREFCLLMSVLCRYMILPSDNVRGHNGRDRVLFCKRVLMWKGASQRVSYLPTCLFMVLRRVLPTSFHFSFVNWRRYNRGTRGDDLSYAIQSSGPRSFSQFRLGTCVFRNLGFAMAFTGSFSEGSVVRYLVCFFVSPCVPVLVCPSFFATVFITCAELTHSSHI